MRMQEINHCRSPEDTIQDGLRILARIIAREAVKNRLAKRDELPLGHQFKGAIPPEFSEYPKGVAQR